MKGIQEKLSYRNLPNDFYAEAEKEEFPSVEMFAYNSKLADELGIEDASPFSGGVPGIAMAYCGHQFGHWSGLLGDGRARLVGEAKNEKGNLFELHLKGAGATPYSRRGDGRATLGSSLREFIVSEAMSALGVPTTRALSVVLTGEKIRRQNVELGAIVCRTARSHIRVGTFEYAATLGEKEVRSLADFVIDRLYPEAPIDGIERYAFLLNETVKKQAYLVSKWMSFGFIHGVMNTDNACISGETIDYGPCAFMDTFHPAKVFSSIDRDGRYAWNRQAEMANWNLARFAESILPLLGITEAEQIKCAETTLGLFEGIFREHFNEMMAEKFGISNEPSVDPKDSFIIQSLEMMTEEEVDFTIFFRTLTQFANGDSSRRDYFQKDWLEKWEASSDASLFEKMKRANPIRIPRNHQIERVIVASNAGDKTAFENLLAAVSQPFLENEKWAEYEKAPDDGEVVQATFCGT